MDLTQPSWAFGGVEPAGWWIRRAGTELTVHLTDAAGALGRRASTSPEGHCEAIDEVTSQLMSNLAAVKTARGNNRACVTTSGRWGADRARSRCH